MVVTGCSILCRKKTLKLEHLDEGSRAGDTFDDHKWREEVHHPTGKGPGYC